MSKSIRNVPSKLCSAALLGRHALARAFIAGYLVVVPAATSAGGVWIEPTYITRIGLDQNGYAFIQVTPSTPNAIAGYAAPACATNTDWQAVVNASTPVGQAFLSLAISARLAHTPIRLIGSGTCTLHGQVETIAYLDILPQ